MKSWVVLFRVLILIAFVIGVAFNVLLFNSLEKQSIKLNSMRDKLEVETEFNSNKFKYQQDQIQRIAKGLEDNRYQIKNQTDALADQKDVNNNIQTSLVDLKAEADAIKQDVKGWQKDYVFALAELEKKMDDSKDEIKSVKDNLDALNIPQLKESINSLKSDIDKIRPPDNALPNGLPASENTIDNAQQESH